jgi:hypothetical protein
MNNSFSDMDYNTLIPVGSQVHQEAMALVTVRWRAERPFLVPPPRKSLLSVGLWRRNIAPVASRYHRSAVPIGSKEREPIGEDRPVNTSCDLRFRHA